jgi:sugar phosphate isomerase/epimerase
MKLSVFTDEISPSSARAVELAAAWGVSHIEVRAIDGVRFPRLGDAELQDFQRRFEDAGLAVSGVSPGLFKCRLDDPSIDQDMTETLPRACEWARRWGSDRVSCFAFRRAGDTQMPDEVVDRLAGMCEAAERAGCRLLLENEAGCWGGTGRLAAGIIRRVGEDRLGLCWDPGNAARAGSASPYPDEYEELRDSNGATIGCVHLKNYVSATGAWGLLEGPDIDWRAQLRALRGDGYDGFVVVETHTDELHEAFGLVDERLTPRESNTLRNIEFARGCL